MTTTATTNHTFTYKISNNKTTLDNKAIYNRKIKKKSHTMKGEKTLPFKYPKLL